MADIIYSGICGLDEAGRGAISGPIVGSAVILAVPKYKIEMISNVPLRDGKTLSPGQRERIFTALIASGSRIAAAYVSPALINKFGIAWSNREIFYRLIRKVQAHYYVIDGNLKLSSRFCRGRKIISIPKADNRIPEVIAAGIAAKVYRDRLMRILHRGFPDYSWDKNAGYGTQAHARAILRYGQTPHHRQIFTSTLMKKYPPDSGKIR